LSLRSVCCSLSTAAAGHKPPTRLVTMCSSYRYTRMTTGRPRHWPARRRPAALSCRVHPRHRGDGDSRHHLRCVRLRVPLNPQRSRSQAGRSFTVPVPLRLSAWSKLAAASILQIVQRGDEGSPGPPPACMARGVESGDTSIPRGATRACRAPSPESFRRPFALLGEASASRRTRGTCPRRLGCRVGGTGVGAPYRCRRSSSIVCSRADTGDWRRSTMRSRISTLRISV
jgi:hypothetical protein